MKKNYLNSGLKLLAVIGLLAVGIFAQGGRAGSLGEKRWELTEINGRRVSGSKAFLEVDASQARFSGNAGCNRMFGAVSVTGRNIDFGSVGTTRMFCGGSGVMKLEADFTRALERVTRYERTGNNLALYARNRLLLKFRSAGGNSNSGGGNNSAARLEDRKWVLESIKNRPLPKVEAAPFVNFDQAKGSAGGNTGCNVFGGNYAASGETIGFSRIVSTMRACIEDERMNVEREFKNGLDTANRYEIKAGKLYLYRNRTLLLAFRAENK